jgi:hypothetical protein
LSAWCFRKEADGLEMIMSDSVRVVVRVVARTETIAEITTIVLRLAAQSRKETGCVSYEVLQDTSNTGNICSDRGMDRRGGSGCAHFHQADNKSQPFLAKPLEVGRSVAIG